MNKHCYTDNHYGPFRVSSPYHVDNELTDDTFLKDLHIDTEKYFINFPYGYDILRETNFEFFSDLDSTMVKHIKRFIKILQNALIKNKSIVSDPVQLPPIKFFITEERTVLIEWIFKDFRIGFSIEHDILESGWYIVSNKKLDEFSMSGPLDYDELEPLLVRLINLAISLS